MIERSAPREKRPFIGPLSGPSHVEDALMFSFRSVDAARAAALSVDAEERPAGAMGVVRDYVRLAEGHGASLSVLHPGLTERIAKDAAWEIGVGDTSSPLAALSTTHVLQLASPGDASRLRSALHEDRDQIAYVHHPAIRYPLVALRSTGPAGIDHQWSLGKCHFRDVWDNLDTGPAPKAIGIIDQGGDDGHDELKDRITKYVKPGIGEPAESAHAGAVAAIISAIRDGGPYEKMKGCCSAELHLYNVWTKDAKFDFQAYYRALEDAAATPVSVLNLSMGLEYDDQTEKDRIDACLRQGVVVVAAMGSFSSSQPVYPAAYKGVIAVGATAESDLPSDSSNSGEHVCLCAPGERILTICGADAYEEESGTSYAAPMVSAAVWLALRKKSGQSVDDIRKLLKKSVDPNTAPNGGHSIKMGHGRLDMLELRKNL